MTTGKFKVMEKEWISIKDKLPKIGEKVLCFWDEWGHHVYVVCIWKGKAFEGADERVTHSEVTHWQPLAPPVN